MAIERCHEQFLRNYLAGRGSELGTSDSSLQSEAPALPTARPGVFSFVLLYTVDMVYGGCIKFLT